MAKIFKLLLKQSGSQVKKKIFLVIVFVTYKIVGVQVLTLVFLNQIWRRNPFNGSSQQKLFQRSGSFQNEKVRYN